MLEPWKKPHRGACTAQGPPPWPLAEVLDPWELPVYLEAGSRRANSCPTVWRPSQELYGSCRWNQGNPKMSGVVLDTMTKNWMVSWCSPIFIWMPTSEDE